ncbi:amidase family protein [Paracoccus seriniphilus]|uniref:Amidase n=1 Tax=Paracoccus seriniphilus TaxID=184748 RepID=A0A239PUH3_9RHOB|nr:amidase family protein [Paracoccus seriniphilus]WCR15459.1 amidase family protein [Paracoccus seriniphilus]SNT73951.1 amidase [Paracoccus seriniphilus]
MTDTATGPIWALTAAQIAQAIRSSELSAVEVAQATLDRLDAVNPSLNAIVDHRPEEVLEQARAVDASRTAGETLGPLAGVPVTIKINIDQKGFATSNGLRSRADLIATENNPVVDGLLRAGAVLLGRTNTPAFSARYFTDNQLFGATHNPRHPSLGPGGSSGGAAAAIASGMGAIAHGNDIGGSIRYPAYACGVHGLRPGLGRVATHNATSPHRPIGAQLMAVQGPLARTVGDLRMGFAAMSGRDIRDPWWFGGEDMTRDIPKRAAFCAHPEGIETASEVEAALRDAAGRLRDAGWQVTELERIPPLKESSRIMHMLWVADNQKQTLQAALDEGDPGAIFTLKGAIDWIGELGDDELGAALTRRAALVRDWLAFLDQWPVLLLPPSSRLPFGPDEDLKKGFEYVTENQYFMTGLPAIGMPALMVSTGLTGDHVPVGVQVLAGRGREELCLQAGEAIEAAGTAPSPIDPVSV